MDNSGLQSFLFQPDRSSQEELDAQRNLFSDKNIQTELLNFTHNCLVVLNNNRQIVYSNEAFDKFVSQSENAVTLGLRTGEALNCRNAFYAVGGCGSSEFCRTCGAAQAITSSLNGNYEVQECRIPIKGSNETLDLRVWAKPLEIDGEIFSVFTFEDISGEKRKETLERIFFHDVLNTVGAVKSFINLLSDSSPEEQAELTRTASKLVDKLLDEIQAQRDLTLAENHELIVNLQLCSSGEIIEDIAAFYSNHPAALGKKIIIDQNSQQVSFRSDESLILRVLGNMLNNALESTEVKGKVTISSRLEDDKVSFSVHNSAYILPEDQKQMFRRFFSTKGTGRGLGTYSMKLFTEEYLHGKISFTSSIDGGTKFTAEFPLII